MRADFPAPRSVPPLVAGGVAAGVGLTLLLVQGLAARRTVIGSHRGRWVHPYLREFSPELLWPWALVLGAALALLWLTRRTLERHETSSLLAWMAFAPLAQLTLRAFARVPLASLVLSDRANGFYSPTLRWSALELISRYAATVPELPTHAHHNMPGKILLYHLLRVVSDSPLVLALLVIGVANLGALLLYAIARDSLGDRRAALYALILYLFVPGTLFFLPILNVVSPLPVLLCLWLGVRWLAAPHPGLAAALGVGLYAAVFFDPLPLALGLVFLALLAAALTQRRIRGRDAAALAGLALAGFGAAHAAMRACFGFDLLAMLAYVMGEARHFNALVLRPYGVWVVQNLFDFATGAGVATVVLLGVGVAESLRGRAPLRARLARPEAVATLSTAVILTLLDLLGVNRGETVRLWIFLAGFAQIVPAWLCARTDATWPFACVLGATLLQGAVGAAMVGFALP